MTASGKAGVSDRLKLSQEVMPAVPVRVMQATLTQLTAPYSLQVAPPADALSDVVGTGRQARGGIHLGLQSTLTSRLPGLRRYFEQYPYVCLEQKVAKAVGLNDATLWADISRQLPSYLDADGLAAYFPPMAGMSGQGTDYLTAHLLAVSHESGFELPAQAREAMLQGLSAYVQGRLQREVWSPAGPQRGLMNDVRRLAKATHPKRQTALYSATMPSDAWCSGLPLMTSLPNRSSPMVTFWKPTAQTVTFKLLS